jgi:hypothetical protein
MTTALRMAAPANRSAHRVTPIKPLRFTLLAFGLAASLFIGMLLALELGRQLGLHQLAQHGAASRAGVGAVDGAVYGLLALLIGFCFSGAAARFDSRRSLVAAEVNAIGTAYQRADLLPPELRGAVRTAIQRYVDAVIESYQYGPGTTDLLREHPVVTKTGTDLWNLIVQSCLAPAGEKARVLLIPSTNEMFGAVEKERLARRIHPHMAIFAMLGVAAISASLFGGYGLAASSTRNWMYMIGVAATISTAVYVIVDLEFPRRGLIRVDSMDEALVELRETMV